MDFAVEKQEWSISVVFISELIMTSLKKHRRCKVSVDLEEKFNMVFLKFEINKMFC